MVDGNLESNTIGMDCMAKEKTDVFQLWKMFIRLLKNRSVQHMGNLNSRST